MRVEALSLSMCLLVAGSLSGLAAQPAQPAPPASSISPQQQEVLDISRQKWRWMADRNVEPLESLFHAEAVFVHMGGTMSRTQELGVIKGGGIHYKHAEIFEESVRFVGTTAIVLARIRLDAVVGGNEVTNPFMVTEVYVKEADAWKLAALSFTRLLK